jgi:hypothetical protein
VAAGSEQTVHGDVAVPGRRTATPRVEKRHRLCPHCGTRLIWVETRSYRAIAYDYYRPCEGGCGLYCYNRYSETFETIIQR